MPGLHNEIIDFAKSSGFNLADRIAKASKRESIGVLPFTDAHDTAMCTMILDLVLQLVIIEIAAEANCRQDDNMPVIHAMSSDISARSFIDVSSDQLHSFSSQCGIAIKTLKAEQDWHDFIATIKV